MVKTNRKRYIAFEIISDKEVGVESIEKAILKSIKELFGEIGISEARPILLKEFSKKNKGVLQINNKYVPKAKLAMALIRKINEKKVILQTKKVYGTLKKIKYKSRG